MYHKEQQFHYGQFLREESQKLGGKKIPAKQNNKNTWIPFQQLNFQMLATKGEGFLREKNYLKANIKISEGVSKFACISGCSPNKIFPGEKNIGMSVNKVKIEPNF